VPASLATVGSDVDVEIRGRAQPARVVRTPFYPSKVKKS
jgi:glycine cleavage system aminomethyltransferase T